MARICKSSSFGESQKWVKGKVIGTGSHGSVHLAMNKSAGSLFVVKSGHSRDGVQCLQNEADVLNGLDSPHIVRYLGRHVSEGSNGEKEFNIFLEYMAGGSLSDVAENFGGSLEEEVIRLYTKEVLLGLTYLHEKGIVHSDVKCKNLLLDSSGSVKLADFGCARKTKDAKRNEIVTNSWKTIGGTPLWMAPEVLRNEDVDCASDIWSLGCVVIEMATGRPPWYNQVLNPTSAIIKIARSEEKPAFPLHLSVEGLDFLAKCFERNPAKRWTAEKLLDHPFISSDLETSFACSPASVFGMSKYEYDSDVSESSDDDNASFRNSIQRRDGEEKLKFGWEMYGESIYFDSSKDWITVRSIDDQQ